MANKIPKIKSGVRVRKEEFGALVFTNRTPILTLNEDSFLIWNTIDGVRSIEQMVKHLLDNNPEKEITFEIVDEFIKACEDLDLIEL